MQRDGCVGKKSRPTADILALKSQVHRTVVQTRVNGTSRKLRMLCNSALNYACLAVIAEDINVSWQTNANLCAAVKDKALVLEELEQLRAVQTELTQQVTDLTSELERERSKVHALRAELDKHEKHDKAKVGCVTSRRCSAPETQLLVFD